MTCLEMIGFLLTAILVGISIYTKWTKKLFPLGLQNLARRQILRGWVGSFPQTLPSYNFKSPRSIYDIGLIATDSEWELEKPKTLVSFGDTDDILLYGVDDLGSCIVVKMTRLWGNRAKVDIAVCMDNRQLQASFEGESASQMEFSLGTFKLELVEPFRCWRICYNEIMLTQQGKPVHVKLNFLWKAMQYPQDNRRDVNISLLSKSSSSCLSNLNEVIPSGYSQFGSLHGTVEVNKESPTELYLYGSRGRALYANCDRADKPNVMEIFAIKNEDSDGFRLKSNSENWIGGDNIYNTALESQISQIDTDSTSFKLNSTLPKAFTICDRKSSRHVEIWPGFDTAIDLEDSFELILFKVTINGRQGRGLILRQLKPFIHPKQTQLLMSKLVDHSLENPLWLGCNGFLPLNFAACQRVDLVGGKAASLARLVRFQKDIKGMQTSPGFCIGVPVFREMNDLVELEAIFSSKSMTLEQQCNQVCALIQDDAIVRKLQSRIASVLEDIFDLKPSTRFAVRSSGVLEDGADLSCAGQNETFLGVDATSIAEKMVDCWASLFSVQSVNYRINHGQPIVTVMGVVVQEMIDASSAGVLFTANPLTGNPFEMLITSNYGLGESIVSGTCDPDSITVNRKNVKEFQTSDFSIGAKSLGSKQSKVILDSSSTSEMKVDDTDAMIFSVSDETAIQLAVIAAQVEKSLGNMRPVDLEWAVSNGEIYILQCRPMTSLDAWTNFEILHQFDTTLRNRNDRITIANTGEVMPAPIYPIGVQSMTRNLDLCIQLKQDDDKSPACAIAANACPIYMNRFFLSAIPLLYRQIDGELNANTSCIDLPVFGRPVITPEVHQIAKERYGVMSGLNKLSSFLNAIYIIWKSTGRINDAVAKYSDWRFPLLSNSEERSRDLYDRITQSLLKSYEVSDSHCHMSEVSSTTLVFSFLTLTEGKNCDQWNASIYEDIGKLLTAFSCVESAEIPDDINDLAEAVAAHSGYKEPFLSFRSSSKVIMEWLKSDEKVAAKLDLFFKKHGHRSYAELDPGQDSWNIDPSPLFQSLRGLVKSKLKNPKKGPAPTKAQLTEEELLDSLLTPISGTTKKILKFLLPHCRKTVAYREKSKSLCVRVLSQIKDAYVVLAEKMLDEHLIPDKALFKYLTHSELGLLIEGHYSTVSILYRANRRLKMRPEVDSLEFEEMYVGFPKPLNTSAMDFEAVQVIQGSPVSAGKVTGIAKVCLTVGDAADQLEEGDILITRGTDIAWSPFFPMLGGVVTELGGLISHGAVVAREYGLPCLVGALNATKAFRSGDHVLLDTATGTISKIKLKDL